MLTLTEAAGQIRARRLSPVELTRECLARIERLNPQLNAFITVSADLALEAARRAEHEIGAGNYLGPLHGVPIAVKDLFDTAGVRTTAASNQYRERVPAADAELVRRLKQAGAVLLGKLNLHEFAFGMSGVVSAFGAAGNPRDPERIAGGSSSGSAAAVAGGLCVAALGTDTAGSIRCPAALCGIVGHRPSAGLLSMKGVVPLSPSFDTAGPMTATVRDAATLIDALANSGYASLLNEDVSQLRVGLPETSFFSDLEPDVAACVNTAFRDVVGKLVAQIREIEVPVDGFRTIFNAEIYEYHEAMLGAAPQLYQPGTLERVRKCAGISATDYIRERRRLSAFRMQAERIFEQVDVVLTPTVPIEAPRVAGLQALEQGELRKFEVKYLMRNTSPFSVLFWPTTSVPCGFTSSGLPVGMQISSRPGADSVVLRLAHAYEQATEWRRKPAIGS
ncbi:MAG TPA: amidase [Candidatus Binatia bacterium]|nr:amidase [Candidatus Binatia bacterium]